MSLTVKTQTFILLLQIFGIQAQTGEREGERERERKREREGRGGGRDVLATRGPRHVSSRSMLLSDKTTLVKYKILGPRSKSLKNRTDAIFLV